MNILIFTLIAYGITNIIVYGSIFEPIREFFLKLSPSILGKLVTCPMCSGFWVGVGLSFLITSPIGVMFCVTGYLNYFLTACFTSGSVWIIHNLEEALERHHKKEDKNEEGVD